MATYKVKGPDGQIHLFSGPDGASPDEVIKQAQLHFSGADQTDTPEEAPAEPTDTRPTSQVSGFLQSFTRPGRNVANWMGVDTSNYDRRVAGWNQETKPGTAGSIAGSVVAGLPVAAITKNPWAVGGAMGALESQSDTPGGVVEDTAIGAIGGKVGDVALRAAGSVIAPRFRAAVNSMLKRGVRLTPGQIMGGSLHKMEDASTSIPFLGDLVTSSQNRGLGDFNKAVVNEALAPMGKKIPDNIAPGHASIKYAQDEIGKAYDAILPGLNVYAPRLGSQAQRDLSNLITLTRNMPATYVQRFDRILNDEIVNKMRVPQPGGGHRLTTMSGQQLKDTESILGQEASKFMHSPDPHHREYGEAILELQTQLREWAANSNPRYAAQLKAINAGYANLTRAETAAANTRTGVFTPDQFRAATRAGDKSVRGRISAAGGARMQDMAVEGTDTLARTLGESGTASRWAINAGVGTAIGGGIHLGAINPLALGAIGGILAPYTRAGGAIFRGAIKRPRGAAELRAAMEKGRGAAAIAGADQFIQNKKRQSTEED